MRYSKIRGSIKSGDIIALSHYKWASLYDLQIQIVRLSTQSEYCHIGLVWEIGGRLFVIESVTPKIRIKPLSHFVEDGFYWIPMDKGISEAELEFALGKVGKGQYSKWQAIKGQLSSLKIGVDDFWQCAEFLIECRKLSGCNLGDKATPAAVVKTLQTQGFPVFLIDEE